MSRNEGTQVVVMGGTAGIGLATALALTAEGANVTVTGRDPAKLAAVKSQVGSAEQVDGTDEAAVAAFFERVGAFDHLVLGFSPGPVGAGPVREQSGAAIGTAFGKVLGYLTAIRHARVTGSVTVIGAVSARAGMAGTAVLAAVNGAVERMVPPLAAELAPVRVNAVSPGVIDTPWWAPLPTAAREAQFAVAAQAVALGRVGQPGEVADAVRYLIGASYVTGVVLPVDGGFGGITG